MNQFMVHIDLKASHHQFTNQNLNDQSPTGLQMIQYSDVFVNNECR